MTHLLRAEWSKLRHSKLMWLVLLTPVLISAQGTANFMRYKHIWTRDAWTVLIEQSFIFLFVAYAAPVHCCAYGHDGAHRTQP